MLNKIHLIIIFSYIQMLILQILIKEIVGFNIIKRFINKMDNEQLPVQENEEEKVKPNTKELQFKEYPSIELSTRDKTIKAIRDLEYDKQNILWVCSQKIHGSNFSIHCSGEKIRYGRRTDFLSEQIDMNCEDAGKFFKQSFYDARNLVNTFHNKIINVYKNLKEIYPDMLKFSIYGEYFGGSYPGIEGKVKHVQKGVYYIPHHQFMAFDIKIFTEKTAFWVDVTDIPKCLKDNIKSVPIYSRGTFDQLFAINSKIDSTIPQLLGFPKVQKNIIQGFVIRPNRSLSFKNHERCILKKKNEQFVQATSAPKVPKQKKQQTLDPELVPYVEALQVYLNKNRIQSVISKFPDLKDRNKLKQEVIKDIMSDAAKDQFKEPGGELSKKLKSEFDKRVIKALNQYYVKH